MHDSMHVYMTLHAHTCVSVCACTSACENDHTLCEFPSKPEKGIVMSPGAEVQVEGASVCVFGTQLRSIELTSTL